MLFKYTLSKSTQITFRRLSPFCSQPDKKEKAR